MKLDKNLNILIVGLGLIGGSYAQALSEKGYHVTAITKEQSSVDYALEHGYVEKGYTEVTEEVVSAADLIIFALYPRTFTAWLEQYGKLIKKGAVVTDVTGVKEAIIDRVLYLLPDGVEFIAAHPMAGRELSGIEYSDASLFKVANYIVVPTEQNEEETIEMCEELGRELGFARITRLSPAEHDKMIAFLSQLTHCIAVSLMCTSDEPGLEKYTGDSFRDLTRIAKINDEMWSELFTLNRPALLAQMDAFAETFNTLREALARGDTDKMRSMMQKSTQRRKTFDKK